MKNKKEDERSVADQIWDEIKDLKLDLFALPNQTVNLHYKPIPLDPTKCFLVRKTRATSSLHALSELIEKKYNIEQTEKYVIISRK